MKSRIIRLSIIAIVLSTLGALFQFYAPRFMSTPGNVQVSGKPLIGGPFSLLDQTGKRVSEQDFRGKHMLVYFGYTFCPDICPAELQVITAALEILGDKARAVTPLFITLDPKRDTVEQMKSYVSNFHERLVGLTGTEEEIRAVAKAYRIYFAEVKNENTSDGYSVDHSSIVFLMGPDGEYEAHFTYGTSPEKMAQGIAEHL